MHPATPTPMMTFDAAVSTVTSVYSNPRTQQLAVVMPSDHRGPAVQLNIQPNSQPTTLITLYQLPPGPQHPVFVTPPTPEPSQAAMVPQEPVPPRQQPVLPPAGVFGLGLIGILYIHLFLYSNTRRTETATDFTNQ